MIKSVDARSHQEDDRWVNVQLPRWQRQIEDIPPIRVSKIAEIRWALEHGAYDLETPIDKVLNNLRNDVGVLCRK